MRRFYSSALASAILLLGVSPVQADYVVDSGSTLTQASTSVTTDQVGQTGASGTTFTQNIDIDCSSSTLYGTADNVPHQNRLCINKVITNTSGNTSNITSNDTDISTNASNISTNTSNITTNTSNINNLGKGVSNATALTAALTALPQVSTDSRLSCGVGSGAYSSSYAIGVGCASKVNEKVDLNFGGSYVGGGSQNYGNGSLDNVAVKAGFVLKLGKINKPTLISMNDKKALQAEVKELKFQNLELISRLEKLERIALGNSQAKDLARKF